MEIIDAQIHEPAPPKPLGSQFQGKELELLVNTELAREAMDAIGVDRALINAPNPFLMPQLGDIRTASPAAVESTIVPPMWTSRSRHTETSQECSRFGRSSPTGRLTP
jgi:hypothetical protein